MEGWISLYRKFKDWQWYKDTNVKSLFIHLLLCASYKNEKWIERGQIITTREDLSKEVGLSIQQIRTCLLKLEKTKEIQIKTTNKYTIIKIINYDKYQKNINEQSIGEQSNGVTNKKIFKVTSTLTSKNMGRSTNKITNESFENTGIQKTKNERSTIKKKGKITSTLTNKNKIEPTSKIIYESIGNTDEEEMENKSSTNKENCEVTTINNIYYIYINNIINKYNKRFKMCTSWFEKLKLQKELLNDGDFKKLPDDQQEKIYKDLI